MIILLDFLILLDVFFPVDLWAFKKVSMPLDFNKNAKKKPQEDQSKIIVLNEHLLKGLEQISERSLLDLFFFFLQLF